MDIFKLVVSYLENLVSVTTSEPMMYISNPGDLQSLLWIFHKSIMGMCG